MAPPSFLHVRSSRPSWVAASSPSYRLDVQFPPEIVAKAMHGTATLTIGNAAEMLQVRLPAMRGALLLAGEMLGLRGVLRHPRLHSTQAILNTAGMLGTVRTRDCVRGALWW